MTAPIDAAQVPETTVTAYKALNAGFTCRNHKFEVGKSYEVQGKVKTCRNGFHACENPWDVLGYYGLIDGNGLMARFAKVTLAGEIDREGNKICGGKITIEAELGLPGFIKAGIDWLIEATKGKSDLSDNGGYHAQIGSSGNYAQIGSSGYHAKIGSSGNYAQIGSSGYHAKIGSSGNYAKINATGANATVACANGSETVTVGENGAFCIPYHDGERTRFLTGYAGEDGIEAGKAYRVRDGKLVEA